MGAAEKISTYRINEVEIFAVGKWNGDEYTLDDLHSMVSAFNALERGFRPYLKLGHDEKQVLAKSSGMPALGWVENVRVKGDKLVADFTDIPETIYKLIESKAYRKVSCEIYWDLDFNGEKLPRVLGAVALLGAENPGVMNLEDILSLYDMSEINHVGVFKPFEIEVSFKQYSMDFNLPGGKMGEKKLEELQSDLEAQKKEYSKIEKDKEALQAKLDEQAKEIEKFKTEQAAQLAELNKAKVEKFCAELEAKKLITPAMKDHVAELMSDKKEYSIKKDDKDEAKTKEQLVSELLEMGREAAKVNFDESSKAEFGKKKDEMGEIEKEVEVYMQENKCDYAKAYKEVMRSKKSNELDEE